MTTTKQTRNREIASDWNLWREYIDPSGVMTREEFDAMTIEERVASIEGCFPPDAPARPTPPPAKATTAASGYTPGPWRVASDTRPTVRNAHGFVVCEMDILPDRDTTAASARLIAAAPELAGCLRAMLARAEQDEALQDFDPLNERARTLLARIDTATAHTATGEDDGATGTASATGGKDGAR
jgi:hypothetical protein